MRATGILLLGVLLAQPTSPLGRTHRMAESVVASTSVPDHAAAPRSGRVAKSEKETPRAPGPPPCGLRGLRGLRGGDSDAARTGGHSHTTETRVESRHDGYRVASIKRPAATLAASTSFHL